MSEIDLDDFWKITDLTALKLVRNSVIVPMLFLHNTGTDKRNAIVYLTGSQEPRTRIPRLVAKYGADAYAFYGVGVVINMDNPMSLPTTALIHEGKTIDGKVKRHKTWSVIVDENGKVKDLIERADPLRPKKEVL